MADEDGQSKADEYIEKIDAEFRKLRNYVTVLENFTAIDPTGRAGLYVPNEATIISGRDLSVSFNSSVM